jgi:glycosyltransferase involved in cell wall biosynthesis
MQKIQPKQVDKLVQAMTRMISDESFREHLASNARAEISNKFNREIVWKSLLDEYKLKLPDISKKVR